MPPKDKEAEGAGDAPAVDTKEAPAEQAPPAEEAKVPATRREPPPPIPAEYEAYAEDSGMGYENQTAEDISIPFIDILQSGSPECKGEDPQGKPGQIINRSSGLMYDAKEGAVFIPCFTEHMMTEWVPLDKGGGLVGNYAMDDPLVKEVRSTQPLGKYKKPGSDNELVETFYVYGIFVPPGDASPHPAVMAMSSTKIKPYKDWMFQARAVVITLPDGRKLTRVPLWAHRYRFTTKFVEKNNYSWWNWVIRFDGSGATEARNAPDSELYMLGKQLYAEVQSGMRRADTESLRREEQDAHPGKGDTSKEEAPY